MILKWKRCGSCGLIYDNTASSSWENWGKPCQPVQLLTEIRIRVCIIRCTTDTLLHTSTWTANFTRNVSLTLLSSAPEATDHKIQPTSTDSMYRLFAVPNISSQVDTQKVQGITKWFVGNPTWCNWFRWCYLIYVVYTVKSSSNVCTSSFGSAWADGVYCCKRVDGDVCLMHINWAT